MKEIEYNIPVFENKDKADLANYSEKMASALKTQIDKFGNPLIFKGTVNTLAELGELENVKNGEIFAVKSENKNFVWNGGNWLEYSDNIDISEIEESIQKKVDKVNGKELSSNDFTNELKQKLENIEEEATKNIVEDLLTSASSTNSLSAKQGKILNENKVPKERTVAGINLVDNITVSELATALKKAIGNLMYPVGSIYFSTKNTNPSSLFGGTWVVWGSGRVPVGVNTSDTLFNSVEKTGGAKTVNLQHRHLEVFQFNTTYSEGTGVKYTVGDTVPTGDIHTSYEGSTTQSIVQPYITCYMFKRTS